MSFIFFNEKYSKRNIKEDFNIFKTKENIANFGQ